MDAKAGAGCSRGAHIATRTISQHLDSRHGSHGRMTRTEESIGGFLVTSVPTRGWTLITITENGLSSESGAAREITGDDEDDDDCDQWLPTANSVLYWYVLCVLALLKLCYSRASVSPSLFLVGHVGAYVTWR